MWPFRPYTVLFILVVFALVSLFNYSLETADSYLRVKVKVSYVTSFWAEPDGSTSPHKKEMKAALLSNVYNLYVDQAVVFLDGVTQETNCEHFLHEMKELNKVLANSPVSVGDEGTDNDRGEEVSKDPLTKLTCVDMPGSQPTYYQMFQNTLHDSVKGDIVVLANADQAFDQTMRHAHELDPDVLLVLTSLGFGNTISPETKHFYDTLVNKNTDQTAPGRCHQGSTSWDTWIYHKSKLMGLLKAEDFARPDANNEMVQFYMNENGAENAALWAVQQSNSFKSHYNACELIHSWHFHLTPQTHKGRKTPWLTDPFPPSGFVPYPWSNGPPMIAHELEQFLQPTTAVVE